MMSEATCVLCFSFGRYFDIKHTHLQNVYEKLSDKEIQGGSNPLCYICYTKLVQCDQLVKKLEDNNSTSQSESRPLVQLSCNSDNWSVPSNYVEIEVYPNIKQEYTAEDEDVKSSPCYCTVETVKIEFVKEEQTEESPEHCKDRTDEEPVKNQHTSTKRTAQNDRKCHACNVCNKKFSYLCNLKSHKLIHTGEKPYSCDICSKTFTQSCSLKKHKLIHTNEKPFSCDVCFKKFSSIWYLKTHTLIHTGEKPYKCEICSKTFTQASSLNMHKRIHDGVKRYTCDVCNKTFIQSCHLKRHKQSHSEIRPYGCDVCSKRFTQTGHLKRHKQIHTV